MRPSAAVFELDERSRYRQWVGAAAAIILIVSVGYLTRWSTISQVRTFGNQDIAGITYNADLLLHGKLPMVDNLEYKAPGSFFATALVFGGFGRSVVTLERFGVVWAIAAALGVFCVGWWLFGLSSGLVAGLIYAVWSLASDNLTVNYNSWMITPYVWATALFVAGLRRGAWGWFLASGALVAIAGLMKRQGGALAPVLMLVLLIYPWLQRPAGWPLLRVRRSVVAWLSGLGLGFMPLTLFYLFKGGTDAAATFLEHFFLSSSGWRYAAAGTISWADKLDRSQDGLLGFWEFMALPSLLAGMTVASVRLSRARGWGLRGTLLALHALFSVIGLALGFRFYLSYYLQVLPVAAWLAAHPDGPILRWTRRDGWPPSGWGRLSRVALLLCLAAVSAPALVADWPDIKQAVRRRPSLNLPQLEALRLGKHIKARSKPSDKLWVWGRWAWPVYFHAERFACTRYYKVLGVITTNLDNTWKRPTSMTRFDSSGPWREIGADLDRCRPLFIVTALNESYVGFRPLEQLLAKHYRQERAPRTRGFKLYRRKDAAPRPKSKTHPEPQRSATGS